VNVAYDGPRLDVVHHLERRLARFEHDARERLARRGLGVHSAPVSFACGA